MLVEKMPTVLEWMVNDLCADPEGNPSPDHTPENHTAIWSLSNTGLDPLENHKATTPASMLGHHRPAREMPFKWHFAGGPMIARLLC